MIKVRASTAASAVLIVFLGLATSGCAKVPPQAVVLSRTVGERIADVQASHEAFLRGYFQLTRKRIEDFLADRWIPTFLDNFVKGSDLMNKLVNVQPLTEVQLTNLKARLEAAGVSPADQAKVLHVVNSTLGDPDRGKLVLQFSEAALKQIELKRKSLLSPVDELERQALDELRKTYAELQQAQSTVTAHLSSIQQVTAEQDKVLERLGLLRKRDAIVESAINLNQQVMGILDAGKDGEKTITDLSAFLEKFKKLAAKDGEPK